MHMGKTADTITDSEKLYGVIQGIKLEMAQRCVDFECYGLEKSSEISSMHVSALCELLREASYCVQKNICLTGIVVYFKQSWDTIRTNIFISSKNPIDSTMELKDLNIGKGVIELGGNVYIRNLDDLSGIVIVAEIKK